MNSVLLILHNLCITNIPSLVTPAEWTGTLVKFLGYQLSKLQDYYHLGNQQQHGTGNSSGGNGATANGTTSSSSSSSGVTANGTGSGTPTSNGLGSGRPASPGSGGCLGAQMNEEQKLAFKQWHYCVQLGDFSFSLTDFFWSN